MRREAGLAGEMAADQPALDGAQGRRRARAMLAIAEDIHETGAVLEDMSLLHRA